MRVCHRSLLLAYVKALGDDSSDPVKRREAYEAAQRVMAEEQAKDQGAGGSAAASSGPASSRPASRSSLSGRSARHLPAQARQPQAAGSAGGAGNSREPSGSIIANMCSELPATQQQSKQQQQQQQQQQQHDATSNISPASSMMVDGGSLAGPRSGGSEQGHSRSMSLSRRPSAQLPEAPLLAATGSLGQPLGGGDAVVGGDGSSGGWGPRLPDLSTYKRACWSLSGPPSGPPTRGGRTCLSISSCYIPYRMARVLLRLRFPIHMAADAWRPLLWYGFACTTERSPVPLLPCAPPRPADSVPGEELHGGAAMSTDGPGPAAAWGDRVGSTGGLAGAASLPPGSFAGSGTPREYARPGSEPVLPAYMDRPSPSGLRPPMRTSAWGAHQVLEPEIAPGVPFSPFAAAARTAELLSLRHGPYRYHPRPQPPQLPKGLQLPGPSSYGSGSVGPAGPPSSGHGHSHGQEQAASGVAPMDEGSSYSLGFAASPARAAMQARAAVEHAHGPPHQQQRQQPSAATWSVGPRDTGFCQAPHGAGVGMPQGHGQTARNQPDPMPCSEDVDRARSAPNLYQGAFLPFAHGRGPSGSHGLLSSAALGDFSAGQRGPAASREHSPWQQQQPNLGHLRQEGSDTMSCGVEGGTAQPWGSSLVSPSSHAGAYDPMQPQQQQQQQQQGGPGSASSRPSSTHSLCSNLSQQGFGEPWAQQPAPEAVPQQQPGPSKVPWSAPPPPPFSRSVGLDPDVSVGAYAALTPPSRGSLDAPRGPGAAPVPSFRGSLDAPRGPGDWPVMPGSGGASQGPPLGFAQQQQQQQERQGSGGQMQGVLPAFGPAASAMVGGGGGSGGAPAGKLKQQPSVGSRRPGSSLQTLHEEELYVG